MGFRGYVAACFCALSLCALGAAPSLDPTFGVGGRVQPPSLGGAVDSIAVGVDGRMFVSDYYKTGGDFVCIVSPPPGFAHSLCPFVAYGIIRLDSRGDVDDSFAGGGVFAGGRATKLLMQSDGKVIAVTPPAPRSLSDFQIRED